MSGGIGAALSLLFPPDRHFGFFLAVEKETPLRRAERKVGLRDLFCVKNVRVEQRRNSWKGKICYSLSQLTLTAPSMKEPDIALSDRFGFCPLSPADSSLFPSQSRYARRLCSAGNPLSASLTSPFQGSTQWESREDVTWAHSVCVV